MTVPDDGMGTTEDPRVRAALDRLGGHVPLSVAESLLRIIAVFDEADAAAGIRRVTLDEAIERAAEYSYDKHPGQDWATARTWQKRAHREHLRPIIAAALGDAS